MPVLHAFRPALANQQKPDAFQQIRRSIHTLSQKNVSLRFVVIQTHLARDQNGRSMRRQVLDGSDQLWTIEPGHGHVGQNQIDPTLFETFQRLFAAREANNAIAAGFQHDLAMGKRLFVIVDTQDCPFWLHFLSAVRWRAGSTQRKTDRSFSQYEECQSEMHANGKPAHCKVPPTLMGLSGHCSFHRHVSNRIFR
jgi:hypothetical protein